MNNTKSAEEMSQIAQPHPPLAAVLSFALVVVATLTIYLPRQSVLLKNWIATFVTASGLLILTFWVIPRWAPKINRYLWTASRIVSVTYSAAVAIVSFFVAILVCLMLFYIAQWQYPTMTDHWQALWTMGLVSGFVPFLVVIYLGLEQAGATKRFKWLDAAQILLTPSKKQFNDRADCSFS